MQFEDQDRDVREQALEAMAQGKPTPKPQKPNNQIANVEGSTAGALADKTAEAQRAASTMANRDAAVFAQTYLAAFDANLQAINSKLTQVWQTVGGYDVVGEADDVPPFTETLDQMFAAWQK